MKRFFAVASLAMLLMSALMAQRSEDGARTDFWTLSVDKDKGKEEQSIVLRDPRTVTICSDGWNPVFLSLDGKHWHEFPLTGSSCLQAPPVRMVKLTTDRNTSSTAEVYATY